jgi:hypothetical protein
MAISDGKQRVEALIQAINARFPGAVVQFSTRTDPGHTELWVYVTNLDQYPQIEAFCQELEAGEEQKEPPIWVFAKAWSGPWPGGESLQEIERRREEFKRAHNLTIGTPA